jgi:hypothetical protein
VKIKGTCRRCGREFLVEQVLANGGECPWDGRPFQPDYAVVLVDALRDAERAGSDLEDALRKAADLGPDFVLDADSVLEGLREQIERLERLHAHGSPARS